MINITFLVLSVGILLRRPRSTHEYSIELPTATTLELAMIPVPSGDFVFVLHFGYSALPRDSRQT